MPNDRSREVAEKMISLLKNPNVNCWDYTARPSKHINIDIIAIIQALTHKKEEILQERLDVSIKSFKDGQDISRKDTLEESAKVADKQAKEHHETSVDPNAMGEQPPISPIEFQVGMAETAEEIATEIRRLRG